MPWPRFATVQRYWCPGLTLSGLPTICGNDAREAAGIDQTGALLAPNWQTLARRSPRGTRRVGQPWFTSAFPGTGANSQIYDLLSILL
jgi:hypothetical protein